MKNGSLSRLSRRAFSGAIAGAGAAATLAGQQPPAASPNTNNPVLDYRRNGPPPEVEPFAAPIEFKRHDVTLKAQPFAMNQVRVTGGIYKDAEE
jgi:hypothetical protein